MKKPNLGARLSRAAEFAREGAYIADVGTDHAYLPVSLCLDGKIRGAAASDVRDGPLLRARANVEKYGLAEKIKLIKTDGLAGIDAFAPDDIFILGMGGELIADIIRAAGWTKNEKIRLILQPMTAAERMREFLITNGYEITEEALAKEDKIYQILRAKFTGKNTLMTPAELYFGKLNLERKGPLLAEFAARQRDIFAARRDGKRSAGYMTPEEDYFLAEIEKIKEEAINDG